MRINNAWRKSKQKAAFLCGNLFLIETITIPLSEYLALKQMILELQEQIKVLRQEIELLKNGHNSKTSSTPPAHDIGRSNKKNLRVPSTRKPGGQAGHEGSTLEMREKPDKIVEYRPDYCNACGEMLESQAATLVMRKQVIVIPPIVPQCIEHQSYSCQCKKCGHETLSELPAYLQGNIQYGTDVNSLVGYFSVRHYLPYNRIAEMMRNVFNINLSEGTVGNMLKSLAQKALPAHEQIKQGVLVSPVVGGDETGVKIKGDKGWLFTFQTTSLTYLAVSLNRGFDTIQSLFKNGFPISVYVTDCLAAQLKTFAKAHQICMAHLLRELNNFTDALGCQWSMKMKQLIKEAIEAMHNCIAHQDYSLHSRIIVTEKIDKLIFSNAGSFFEGNPDDYSAGEKTPERYRNTWLGVNPYLMCWERISIIGLWKQQTNYCVCISYLYQQRY